MRRILLIATIVAGIAVWAHQSQAADIGFIEDFALAPDRSVPLKQLVPGTEDYYYYHCLHYQNTGDLDRADAMLKTWIGRYTNTSLIREIQNRQALLKYEKSPQASLNFLKSRLGLLFNHRREIAGQKPTLSIELKGKLISRGTLTARALTSGNLRSRFSTITSGRISISTPTTTRSHGPSRKNTKITPWIAGGNASSMLSAS